MALIWRLIAGYGRISLKICVIGGCGFLGSAICEEALKQNIDVDVVSLLVTGQLWWDIEKEGSDSPTIWEGNPGVYISDIDGFSYGGYDGVINCAWVRTPSYVDAFKEATGEVLTLIREMEIKTFDKMVQISSAKANVPYENSYGALKAACDMACAGAISKGLNISIMKPWNMFGPRQPAPQYKAFLPMLLHNWINGNPFTVYSGHTTLNFEYVKDVARASINCVSDVPTIRKVWSVSTEDLIELVRSLGIDGEIVIDKERNKIPDISDEDRFRDIDNEFISRLEETVDWTLWWESINVC